MFRDNPWFQRILNLTKIATERWDRQVSVVHTDLGGNWDFLASMCTYENLLLNVTVSPEQVERLEVGTKDGRKSQPEACEPYDEVIQVWMDQQSQQRPEPIKTLYELLVTRYGYSGSYRSVLRYVRRRTPVPKVRPIRRVETAVGAQTQIDWVQGPWIYIEELGGRVRLQAF